MLFSIQDVNECQTKDHACDKNAICINHRGSYECRCRKGFSQLEDEGACVENSHLKDDYGEMRHCSTTPRYLSLLSSTICNCYIHCLIVTLFI